MLHFSSITGFFRGTPLAACLVLSAGCGGSTEASELELAANLASLITAIDGVQFGPPLGPEPVVTWPFDASLLPPPYIPGVVEPRLVLELESESSAGQRSVVASFSVRSTPALSRLAPPGDLYFVNLRAATYFTDARLLYRFRLRYIGRELGAADVDTARVFAVLGVNPNFMFGVKIRVEARPAPTISQLTPASLPTNRPVGTLTVDGSGFVRDSVVRLGGTDLVTTWLSSSRLQATVPAARLAVPGSLDVTVNTPTPGGGTSAASRLEVTSCVPVVEVRDGFDDDCDGFVDEVPVGFVTLPAGTATLGSPTNELGRTGTTGGIPNQPWEDQVSVTLSRDFYLQTTEVTQGQWKALSGGVNPSCFQRADLLYTLPAAAPDATGNCDFTANANDAAPVERVSWWSALGYLNARSQSEGLPPCYTLPSACTGSWQAGTLDCGEGGGGFAGRGAINGDSYTAPTVNVDSVYSCVGYRLPTEAEWEYAARAGLTTATTGGNLTLPGTCREPAVASSWYCGTGLYLYNGTLTPYASLPSSDPVATPLRQLTGGRTTGTHPVGQGQPNGWGLYDLHGNVWEWVWDWHTRINQPSGSYEDRARVGGVDPAGPATGSRRVYKGGGWTNTAAYLRFAARPRNGAWGYSSALGFRAARSALP